MKSMVGLLFLLGLMVMLTACADDTPPVAITVGEVCQQEPGTKVVVDGFLSLPSFLICEQGQCRINFQSETGNVLVELVTSDEPRNNRLMMPPDPYTEDDLQVIMADGAAADRTTPVKITGLVKRPSENVCYLDGHSVERQ